MRLQTITSKCNAGSQPGREFPAPRGSSRKRRDALSDVVASSATAGTSAEVCRYTCVDDEKSSQRDAVSIPRWAVAVVLGIVVGGCSTSSAGQAGANRDAALIASCPASTATGNGIGPGPAYLSGQSSWYSGGQAAILMVDSKYSGPLLVRASQLGGDGTSQITLAAENLDPTALAGLVDKERQHGVLVVSGVPTTEGALELQAAPSSPLWRAWFGRLGTSGPGCFALHLDGTSFTEVIVFAVQAGPAPPG